jgi:hypothetical protein
MVSATTSGASPKPLLAVEFKDAPTFQLRGEHFQRSAARVDLIVMREIGNPSRTRNGSSFHGLRWIFTFSAQHCELNGPKRVSLSAFWGRRDGEAAEGAHQTVDGATPTRRAISLSPTPAVLKRSTSRTWRITVLSAGIRSPVQKPKERTLIGPAEAPLNRATSSRNAGRNHLGTPGEIKSEWWATSSRIRGRLPPESAPFATGSGIGGSSRRRVTAPPRFRTP